MTVKSKDVPFEPEAGAIMLSPQQLTPAQLQMMQEQSRAVALPPMQMFHTPRFEFDQDTLRLLRQKNAKLTDSEFEEFVMACLRAQLDPFARQIYAISRWSNDAGREVMAIQVSIDGFRLIAERTGKYEGQEGPFWYDEQGKEYNVWLKPTPPAAARVGVWKKGARTVTWGVATFKAFAAKSPLWTKMPDVMLAKCAESQALRKAFPQELSGLYTSEEMDQADDTQDYIPPPSPNTRAVRVEPEPVVDVPAPPDGWDKARAFIKTQLRKRLGAADDFMNDALQLIRSDLVKNNQLSDEAALKAYCETAQGWETLADAIQYINTIR